MAKRPQTRSDLEAEVTTAMLRVFDKVQRHRRVVRDYGNGDRLTMVEAEICHLIAIAREISPSKLADHIGVSRSAVSQALNKLRARGLVTVEHPPDNAKSRVVRVTPAGAAVASGVNDLQQRMAEAVYASAADLEEILALFERLDRFFADVIDEAADG